MWLIRAKGIYDPAVWLDLVLVILPIGVDRFSDDFKLLFGGGLDNICRRTEFVAVRGQAICIISSIINIYIIDEPNVIF